MQGNPPNGSAPGGGGGGGSVGDDRRYPTHPPSRSSFIGHHLPPPIPSASSPHTYPSPGGGHTDPAGWASERDRIGSSRGRYSPAMSHFDRPPSSSSRLPPLESYHRNSVGGWEAPQSTGFPTWNTRPSIPSAFPHSPTKPPTPGDIRQHLPSMRNGSGYQLNATPSHPSAVVHRSPTQSGAAALTSNKHGSNEESGSVKKKKRRVALSCAECAKRKQRCNRETPCQHCVARRVPELCIPYSRAPTPPPRTKHEGGKGVKEETEKAEAQPPRAPSALPTLSVRVARIEALLNVVVNRVDGLDGKALSDWRINHAPATSPPPIHGSRSVSRRESPRGGSPTASPSPPPSMNEEQESADVEGESRAGDVVEVLDIDTSMRNPLPQSMLSTKEGAVKLGLDYHGTPAEQLQKLFQDWGVSAEKVHDLIRELPSEEHANRLLDWFFKKFNYVRYPIDEHMFRKAYEALYASPSVNPSAILFLPLAYIVFSISTRIAPDEWELSEEEKKTQSLRLYWNCKHAVIIAQAVKAENIQLVETKILTGLYLVLMHDRRLAEGWSEFRTAISIAQALGLHRDGTRLRLDQYTTEYRRRLWSYLVHADATYSCLLGRPTSLDPNFSDTRMPLNLDLSDLLNGKKPEPKSEDEPTFATYLILRRRLGEIVAKVTEHFQLLGEAVQYRDVESIDADFKDFIQHLPRAFRMEDPDKSWDDKLWFLPVHRYYIQTEVLHFIIILHRPWLLRKLRSSRYALSRHACLEAAATDFRIRQAFKKDVPDFFETLLASSFREFNVAMIAGISMIIDPTSHRSADMRAIMTSFLEHYPHDPAMDDFSQKESAIIYTLHNRAKEIEDKRFAESISRPRSSSIRLTQDNISDVRHESMPYPRNGSGEFVAPGMQLPGKSPVSGFLAKQSPMLGSGSGSPDDDQPQQLLDHWLMSNTSFAPPLSSLDPAQTLYATNGDFQSIPVDPYPQPGAMWLDPNLPPGSIPNPGLGMTLLPTQPMEYMPPGGPEFIQAPNGMVAPGVGGQWGDGNSMQYWNTLVDHISANVQTKYDMGVPSA